MKLTLSASCLRGTAMCSHLELILFLTALWSVLSACSQSADSGEMSQTLAARAWPATGHNLHHRLNGLNVHYQASQLKGMCTATCWCKCVFVCVCVYEHLSVCVISVKFRKHTG